MPDPIVNGAIQSTYMKRMYDYMSDVQADLDKNNNVFQGKDWINSGEGIGIDTAIGAGMGALKMGIGVAGLFKDVPGFKEVKSNYVEDPKLAAAATMAMSDAVSNNDDYASRIRVRNQRAAQDLKTLGMSGGDRNFIAANTAASADIENVSNLAIDKQLEQEKQGAMGVAANLQQMALYDRLNKSRDELSVAELNMKNKMWQIEQQNRNTAGAASMIAGGMSDISGAAGNQVANDANKDLQKIMLMNAMAKIGEGGKQEVTTNINNRNFSIGGKDGDPVKFNALQSLKMASLFGDNAFDVEGGKNNANLFDFSKSASDFSTNEPDSTGVWNGYTNTFDANGNLKKQEAKKNK